MLISIHITPKSAKNQIIGWEIGADGKKFLKIKIAAPPEDGKANAELIKFLSKEWKVAKSELEIVSGDTSRHKRIRINNDAFANLIFKNQIVN